MLNKPRVRFSIRVRVSNKAIRVGLLAEYSSLITKFEVRVSTPTYSYACYTLVKPPYV